MIAICDTLGQQVTWLPKLEGSVCQ